MCWATFRALDTNADRVGLLGAGQLHALEPGLALLDLLDDGGECLVQAGERTRADPALASATRPSAAGAATPLR